METCYQSRDTKVHSVGRCRRASEERLQQQRMMRPQQLEKEVVKEVETTSLNKNIDDVTSLGVKETVLIGLDSFSPINGVPRLEH